MLKKYLKYGLHLYTKLFIAWGLIIFGVYTYIPILTFENESTYLSDNTLITDRYGEIFYTFPKTTYTYQKNTQLEAIPQLMQNLIVWKEDRRFYQNHGIELLTKMKIAGEAFFTWNIRRGGSTITEQWIKNKYFVSEPRHIFQKFRELAIAFPLSFAYEKEEILEQYLNHIYFGNLAYGVETASNFYFDKTVSDLNPVEQIFLISLISNPSVLYDENFRFTDKKHFYLDLAKEHGWISDLAYREFYDYKIRIKPPKSRRTNNIFIADMVSRELPKDLNPAQGGFVLESTIDKKFQTRIQSITQQTMARINKKNARDTGVVVMEGNTGKILSLIGSANPEDKTFGQINTVLQKRQIASTIKPFLFYLGFMEGYRPKQVVLDQEKIFPLPDGKVYRVRNFNGHEFGAVTLEKVLANSFNIGCVKLIDQVGVDKFWQLLKDIGFDFEEDAEFYGLSLALGSTNNSLLNLVSDYSLFLHDGQQKAKPYFLNKIIDQRNGEVIYEATSKYTVFDFYSEDKRRQAATQVTRILKDENLRQRSFGYNSLFNNGRNVAYKTGTSSNFHDNFALGFDDEIIVGVWVGNLDNQPMEVLSGIEGSGPILLAIVELLDMRSKRPAPFHDLEIRQDNFAFPEDWELYQKQKTS